MEDEERNQYDDHIKIYLKLNLINKRNTKNIYWCPLKGKGNLFFTVSNCINVNVLTLYY